MATEKNEKIPEKIPKKRLFVTRSQLAEGIALIPGGKITLVLKKRKFVFSG